MQLEVGPDSLKSYVGDCFLCCYSDTSYCSPGERFGEEMAALDKSESWHLEKAFAEKVPLHRPLPNRPPCPTEGQSELPGQKHPHFLRGDAQHRQRSQAPGGRQPEPASPEPPTQEPAGHIQGRACSRPGTTNSFIWKPSAGSALPHSWGAHRRAGAPGVLEASPRTPTSSPVLGAPKGASVSANTS